MSRIWIFSLLCCLIGTAYGSEVCFDDLGCFDDLPPWGGTEQRPIPRLPWKPEMMGTRFLLFTQKSRFYQEITANQTILKASNYNGLRKTRFVIPGYLEKGDEDWPQEMCKVMLKWENFNCIALEWKSGVKTQYAQAANNGRVVGAQVAFMINFIMPIYKQKAEKFHIIGHSMGAHVAGEVGRVLRGLARITGLDPVEPYFQGCDAKVRLDTSDAAFVDVIHTDALPFDKNSLGLGMSQAIGHMDYYPNGGDAMPGCSKNKGSPTDLDGIWQGTVAFDACNHARAHQYYSESSVKPQGFLAYPCFDKESFLNGGCFPCFGETCPLMGHQADRFSPAPNVSDTNYFLNTGSSQPFGRYTYRARVTLDGPSWSNPGIMYIALAGARAETEEHRLHKGMLSPGTTYEIRLNAEVDVGEVKEVRFRWNNHIINPLSPRYGASKIQLVRGKDAAISNFCGTRNVAENTVQAVKPCKA